MSAIVRLDAALKAVCPIDGVSVGTWADRSTWRIDFKLEASVSQRNAAQSVCDAFDYTETIDTKAEAAVEMIERLYFEVAFDMENRMRAREGLQAITRAVYRNALINRWKSLNS